MMNLTENQIEGFSRRFPGALDWILEANLWNEYQYLSKIEGTSIFTAWQADRLETLREWNRATSAWRREGVA